MSRRAAGLAVALSLLGAGAAPAAPAPRPPEFPPPTLAVTVTPVPLGVQRPGLEPPPPPPVSAPAIEVGGAPAPRFASLVTKPLPVVAEPGGFPCFIVAFRRAESIAECGIQRALTGRYQEAREALEESVAIDPRGPHAPAAYVWLGELALLESSTAGATAASRAERWYRTALPLAPPRDLAVHAEIGLGLLALRRGDAAEAEAALDRALRAVPPQPLALLARYLLGVARLQLGKPADAIALWDEVSQSGAGGAILGELPFWRGVALARLGDPQRGQELLSRFAAGVPATHPLRVDALVQLGWIALERGMLDEAVRRFHEADAAAPRPELRPQLRVGLVRAYLALGDLARARAAARQLKTEAPRDPMTPAALLLIADADRNRGGVGDAADVYREILLLPLAPALQDYVRYRLGEALEQEGRVAEAKDQYRELRDHGRDEGIAQRASYRLGLLGLRENDVGAARREGEALLRAGVIPELREGVLLLVGESAARGGDPNRAVGVVRAALREFPESPYAARARLAVGWALLGDGDTESALREWRDAATRADLESRALALLAVADVTIRQGREAEALDALRAIGGAPPGLPRGEVVRLDRGVLAVRTRAWDEAVRTLEPLAGRLTDLPLQALLRRALGVAYYELGQYDRAEQQFRFAASVAPQEPSSWLGAGLAALAQNRLAEADDALGRARYAAVDVATAAWYGTVLVGVRRGDPDLFRERATSFVDRFPRHPAVPAVLYGLAVSALGRGQVTEAQGWTQRLLRDYPQDEHGTDALLRLAAVPTPPEVARQAYRELVVRPATPPAVQVDAWMGLAETALAARDAAEAERAAEGFLRAAAPGDPRTARGYVILARAQESQGQRDRALTTIETFLARFPRDPEVPALQLARGQLLLQAHRPDAAQLALEAARQADSPEIAAEAQYWLGEALRARGDEAEAISAYLGATYLYPDTPWAARGLQGAAQAYVARQMPREAGIVLRKLAARPGVDPALAQWARESLARLGAAADPSPPSRP